MTTIKSYIVVIVSVDTIQSGDTIMIDSIPKTISSNNIRHDAFMGITIFGNAYIEKNRTVEKVLYPYFYRGEFKEYR